MKRLWTYVRPHAWLIAAALILVLIVGALEALSPMLIALIFGKLTGAAPPTISIPVISLKFQIPAVTSAVLLALFIGSTVVKVLAEYASIAVTAFLGQAVVRDIRNDVFERILYQPLRFFHFNATGELISRVSADVERIQTAASETLAEFLKQTAILLFLLVAVFVIDWKLAGISLVLVPLVFYPTVWFGKKLRHLSRSNQQEMADMANVLYETFAGNRIVKAFTMEKSETRKFHAAAQRIFHLNVRQKLTQSVSSPMMEILGTLVIAGFLIYAQTQHMSSTLFIAFIASMIKLYDPIRRMSGINNSFQQAAGASGRIFEILSLQPETDSGTTAFEGLCDRVDFEDVHFEYEAGEPVLRGVSFPVERGEVVAIVGPSGAGKSTLVNLLPRFYDVTAGRVTVDGRNIREFTLVSLREKVAIVTQDVILFNDTIHANIAYGNPEASEESILQAAQAALVDDFVSTLPEGYNTRIGERGLRLSGGERQRISIARALLKNAPILVLDEATSSLDAESEADVQKALHNLMEGRTTIVIAHRLSTVRRADRIVVLEDGRIKESGTHEELIVRRGLYWRFVNLQETTAGSGIGRGTNDF